MEIYKKSMDLRDSFAMNAPPVPSGFTFDRTSAIQKPLPPSYPEDISAEDLKELEGWVKDPCYDLDPVFSDFEKSWKDYWNKSVDYEDLVFNEALLRKQAIWAYQYADSMIAEREEGSIESVDLAKQMLIEAIERKYTGLNPRKLMSLDHLIFQLETGLPF